MIATMTAISMFLAPNPFPAHVRLEMEAIMAYYEEFGELPQRVAHPIAGGSDALTPWEMDWIDRRNRLILIGDCLQKIKKMTPFSLITGRYIFDLLAKEPDPVRRDYHWATIGEHLKEYLINQSPLLFEILWNNYRTVHRQERIWRNRERIDSIGEYGKGE